MQELLQPISRAEPSGKSLRYDALFDTIREARAEDDGTLPMGDWERDAKQADHALVASLAGDALKARSKDLWLAAWLGEAWLFTESYEGLSSALHLLLVLQQKFWPSLHPEIEDDDRSMRGAPLHWAISRYAALLLAFPVTSSGISYAAYKAVRSGIPMIHNSQELTGERLDGEVAASPTSFYTAIAKSLAASEQPLQELYQFCEEQYGDEAPSFVTLRSTLGDIHHAVSRVLRSREQPGSAAPQSEASDPAESRAVDTGTAALPEFLVDAQPEPLVQPAEVASPVPPTAPISWESGLEILKACARYMLEQKPGHPATYLVALAVQHGGDEPGSTAPLSETRLLLKRASETGDPETILRLTIAAVATPSSRYWIDLPRYIWQAAGALQAPALQMQALAHARAVLGQHAEIAHAHFQDDTPVANRDTQQWLTTVVQPPANRAESVVKQQISPSVAVNPESEGAYAAARQLVAQGNFAHAADLLMQDGGARGGRGSFLRRLDLCRLCVENGEAAPATHMLRQLLEEAEERKLYRWEEPALLGELLSLLLQILRGDEHISERQSVYARLCKVHPAMALQNINMI